MPHQTQYQWRPNDNGSITNHRYDLEAEKWVTAFGNATSKLPSGNFGGDLKFMGSVFALPFLLIFLIIMIPIKIVTEIIGFNFKIFPGDEPTGWKDRRTHMQKVDDRINALKEKYKDSGKPKMTEKEIQEIVKFVRSQTAKAERDLN